MKQTILLLIATLFVTVSCQPAPTAVPPTSTMPAPTNTIALPTATPAPTATSTQLAPQLPLALGTYANVTPFRGLEKLTLLDGGSLTEVVTTEGRLVEGTWTLAPDQVTFTETKGGKCSGIQGAYTWAFDGKALTFTKVQDDCVPRASDFPSGPWIKQP